MSCSTISIFGNKIFSEILNEIKLFSKYKIKYYEDLNLCVRDAAKKNQLIIFFVSEQNKNFFNEIKKNNFPLIFVGKSSDLKNSSIYKNFLLCFSKPFFWKDKFDTIAVNAIDKEPANALILPPPGVGVPSERISKKSFKLLLFKLSILDGIKFSTFHVIMRGVCWYI